MIEDAFTQSDYAINTTDPDGILIKVNRACLQLYNIPDEAMILGKTQRIIRPPDTPAAVYKERWATTNAGRIWRRQPANRPFDGEPVFIHLTISSHFDSRSGGVDISRPAIYYSIV